MTKLEQFVSLYSKDNITRIGRYENGWINLFRERTETGWRQLGYDIFENESECRKWGAEFLKYSENKKDEMMCGVRVKDVMQVWRDQNS